MALRDPMETFGKQVEDIRRRLCAEDEHDTVVELVTPGASQEIPVSCADRDVPECVLQIELSEEAASAKALDFRDCGVEGLIDDTGLLVGDSVVN